MGGAVQVADLALGAGTSTTAQLTADKEEKKRKKRKKKRGEFSGTDRLSQLANELPVRTEGRSVWAEGRHLSKCLLKVSLSR